MFATIWVAGKKIGGNHVSVGPPDEIGRPPLIGTHFLKYTLRRFCIRPELSPRDTKGPGQVWAVRSVARSYRIPVVYTGTGTGTHIYNPAAISAANRNCFEHPVAGR